MRSGGLGRSNLTDPESGETLRLRGQRIVLHGIGVASGLWRIVVSKTPKVGISCSRAHSKLCYGRHTALSHSVESTRYVFLLYNKRGVDWCSCCTFLMKMFLILYVVTAAVWEGCLYLDTLIRIRLRITHYYPEPWLFGDVLDDATTSWVYVHLEQRV